MNYKDLSQKYFNTWNAHDIKKLSKLFSDNIILTDWNINVSKKDNVLLENQKIFNDLPEINVEILKIHISESTSTVVTELIVHINKIDKLKVVDLITFNENGLIISIKAYKC